MSLIEAVFASDLVEKLFIPGPQISNICFVFPQSGITP